MDQMLLQGFLVNGITETIDLETVLLEIRDRATKIASLAYEKLVNWQVERIIDEISLNQIKRPEDTTILDMAAQEVRRRVLDAGAHGRHTEFNLYMEMQILTGTLDGKTVTYLKMVAPNDIYSKTISKIKELTPYDIKESDLQKKSKKKEFWEKMQAKYQKDIPITCGIILYDDIILNPENFKFRSPEKRAADIAKENILNQLLAAYACDQQVPPNKLMEYTLQGMERLSKSDIQDMLEMKTENLKTILPEITLEMIGFIPKKKEEKRKKTEENTENTEEKAKTEE